MSIISRMRRQQAVYWEPTGQSGPGGEPLYLAPIEIKCRWDDVQEVSVSPTGEEFVSRSKVYTDRRVKLNGVLKEGKLDSVTLPDEPLANEEAFLIRARGKIPNFRATEFLHFAVL